MTTRILLTVFVALAATACFMSMQSRLEKEALVVSEILNEYCKITTSRELRIAMRNEIQKNIEPNKIVVACAEMSAPDLELETPP